MPVPQNKLDISKRRSPEKERGSPLIQIGGGLMARRSCRLPVPSRLVAQKVKRSAAKKAEGANSQN
jgi:hypothetical protein